MPTLEENENPTDIWNYAFYTVKYAETVSLIFFRRDKNGKIKFKIISESCDIHQKIVNKVKKVGFNQCTV